VVYGVLTLIKTPQKVAFGLIWGTWVPILGHSVGFWPEPTPPPSRGLCLESDPGKWVGETPSGSVKKTAWFRHCMGLFLTTV
jgi:hypothetical protein